MVAQRQSYLCHSEKQGIWDIIYQLASPLGRTALGHSTGTSRLFYMYMSRWPENKLRQVMPGARELSGTVCKPIKEGSG